MQPGPGSAAAEWPMYDMLFRDGDVLSLLAYLVMPPPQPQRPSPNASAASSTAASLRGRLPRAAVYGLMLVAVLSVAVGGIMIARGKLYHNHIAHCQTAAPDGPFCGISTPRLELPEPLKQQIMALLDASSDPAVAVRAHVPGIRAGRTMLTGTMERLLPDVVRWYEQLAGPNGTMSALLGATVFPTELGLPTSCCLLVYDQPDDGIEWHYDVNYFAGRFFTVLVPVTPEPTCTQFYYRDAHAADRVIDLQQPPYAGRSIAFEGANVFHKATRLCADQRRVVLSLQYATDPTLTPWNRLMMFVKDRAFTGLGGVL